MTWKLGQGHGPSCLIKYANIMQYVCTVIYCHSYNSKSGLLPCAGEDRRMVFLSSTTSSPYSPCAAGGTSDPNIPFLFRPPHNCLPDS